MIPPLQPIEPRATRRLVPSEAARDRRHGAAPDWRQLTTAQAMDVEAALLVGPREQITCVRGSTWLAVRQARPASERAHTCSIQAHSASLSRCGRQRALVERAAAGVGDSQLPRRICAGDALRCGVQCGRGGW